MLTYADIPRRFNLTTYFLDRNLEEGRGDRIALYCRDRPRTYTELARMTNRIGHVLKDLSVEMEDRVLIAMADGLEWVATWYAIPKIGAVTAEVYTFLQPKDYEYYLNYTRAKVVVVDETTRAKVLEVAPRCPHLRHVLVAGAVGELWVAGDSTALCYWNDHQKSKRTFAGDWVHTGDLVRRAADGYFWYQGRVDDLLKVGGIWVAPLEIEGCLLEHPAVRECAVVGYEEAGLTLPRAYVVLKEVFAEDERLADELKSFVKARLSPHKVPRDTRFVAELPKTASGKLDRRSLREATPA